MDGMKRDFKEVEGAESDEDGEEEFENVIEELFDEP